MKTVDTTGLSCPQPLLLTQEASKSGDSEIRILIEGKGRADDATEILEKAGYTVVRSETDECLVLDATK